MTRTLGVLFVVVGLLSIGCDSTPRAPALRDSAVYQNRAAGLRFLIPQGWKQAASAVLPSGPIETEFMLAKYTMPTSPRGGTLELLCFDDSKSIDVKAHHEQPSHGVAAWKLEEDATEVTVGGATGQRLPLVGSAGKNTLHKEVTVFRRGKRVYSFVALYWDDDRVARDEIRRAVDSLVWSK